PASRLGCSERGNEWEAAQVDECACGARTAPEIHHWCAPRRTPADGGAVGAQPEGAPVCGHEARITRDGVRRGVLRAWLDQVILHEYGLCTLFKEQWRAGIRENVVDD